MARLESIAVGGYYKFLTELIPHVAALISADSALRGKPTGYRNDINYGSYSFFDPCAGDGEALVEIARNLLGKNLNASKLNPHFYAIELEKDRYETLKDRVETARSNTYHSNRNIVLHGDAFSVNVKSDGYYHRGANVLWLNPPYDTDKSFGRLERKFLERFTPNLLPESGLLIFIVPFYVLEYCADYLAMNYSEMSCFKLPGEMFETYFKQIVFFARRNAAPSQFPNASLVQKIKGWAADSDTIEELPAPGNHPPLYFLPVACSNSGFDDMKIEEIDVVGMQSGVRPFTQGGVGRVKRFVKGEVSKTKTAAAAHKKSPALLGGLVPLKELGLHRGLMDFLGHPYEVAMPPRPAHIAMALASGMFNGHEVEPDEEGSNLPPLIIRGVFTKDFQTIEAKTDKEGKVTSFIRVEQPSLLVKVMDLNSCEHYELKPGAVPSNSTSIENFNVADLLVHYGKGLTGLMLQQFPAMHNPSEPEHQMALPKFERELFKSQHQVVQAALKVMATQGDVVVIGEVGTGKSTITNYLVGLLSKKHFNYTVQMLKDKGIDPEMSVHLKAGKKLKPVARVMVLCPPHLLKSWVDQVSYTLPGALVIVLDEIPDLYRMDAEQLIAFNPNDEKWNGKDREWKKFHTDLANAYREKAGQHGYGLTFYVMSRETAKLGHAYGPGVETRKAETKKLVAEFRACPKCGNLIDTDTKDEDLARKHAVCQQSISKPRNAAARVGVELANLMSKVYPENDFVKGFVHQKYMKFYGKLAAKKIGAVVRQLVQREEAKLGKGKANTNHITDRVRQDIWEQILTDVPKNGSLEETVIGKMVFGLVEGIEKRLKRQLEIGGYYSYSDDAQMSGMLEALKFLVAAIGSRHGKGLVLQVVERLWNYTNEVKFEVRRDDGVVTSTRNHKDTNSWGQNVREKLVEFLLFAGVPGNSEQDALKRKLYLTNSNVYMKTFENTVARLKTEHESQRNGIPASPYRNGYSYDYTEYSIDPNTGGVRMHSYGDASFELALKVLETLGNIARYDAEPCGEFLFKAEPLSRNYESGYSDSMKPTKDGKPHRATNRYALAKYIHRFLPDFFDLLVADELHEYNNASKGSAQGMAFQRLAQLGKPVIGLTGSLMGGYADSLFTVASTLFPSFKQEFGEGKQSLDEFVQRFGYLKVEVYPDKMDDEGSVLGYGRMSERREIAAGKIVKKGLAPGVNPLFTVQYILRHAVFIHKGDLDHALPELFEKPVAIEADNDDEQTLINNYMALQQRVMAQVKADMFSKNAGKLWGAVAEMRAALDLCHEETGNCEVTDESGNKRRAYQIRYPDEWNEELGCIVQGDLVAELELMPNDFITPKEKWMLEKIKEQIGKGRPVMVFLRHTGKEANLVKRLMRLVKEGVPGLEDTKEKGKVVSKVEFLDSKKVSTAIREDWINKNVVEKDIKVLFVNAVSVQTGLNNLVYFKTVIWYEGEPNVNAYVYRQANGRVHRIGQGDPVEIFCLAYKDTAQDVALELLAQKVTASLQVDGLSVEGALEAAGAAATDGGAYLEKVTASNIGKAIAMKILSNMGDTGSLKEKAA